MLTINIHNNGTGTNESANYDYDILVNNKIIDGGKIYGHNRDDGWIDLLKMLYEQYEK